jgi:hypothetical protein
MRAMAFQSTTMFVTGSRWFMESLAISTNKVEELSLQELEPSKVAGSGTGHLPLAPV